MVRYYKYAAPTELTTESSCACAGTADWKTWSHLFPRHACRLEVGDTADRRSALRSADFQSDFQSAVSQASGLLGVRWGCGLENFGAIRSRGTPADWKSAIQQTGGLRYIARASFMFRTRPKTVTPIGTAKNTIFELGNCS